MDRGEVRLWSLKYTRILGPGPGVSVVVKGSSCPVLLQIRANTDTQKSAPWYFYLASPPPSPPQIDGLVRFDPLLEIILIQSEIFIYFHFFILFVNSHLHTQARPKPNTHSNSEK